MEALNWAERLLRTESVQRSEAPERGENIAASGDRSFDVKSAMELWYKEGEDYDYDTPGFSSNTRNFTQMLWAGSEEVGMALSRSEDGQSVVIVARYYPPGNMVGLFQEHVKPKKRDSFGEESLD